MSEFLGCLSIGWAVIIYAFLWGLGYPIYRWECKHDTTTLFPIESWPGKIIDPAFDGMLIVVLGFVAGMCVYSFYDIIRCIVCPECGL